MRRVIAIAVAGASLAGCSSLSFDGFKATPTAVPLQVDSTPQGAEARTSLGQSCRTPCTLQVPAPDAGFDVTFTLDRFMPATVPVQVIRNSGAFNDSPPVVLDPNPIVAELQPAAPPPKGAKSGKAKPMRPKKPKAPKAAAATAGSPFPAPNAPR